MDWRHLRTIILQTRLEEGRHHSSAGGKYWQRRWRYIQWLYGLKVRDRMHPCVCLRCRIQDIVWWGQNNASPGLSSARAPTLCHIFERHRFRSCHRSPANLCDRGRHQHLSYCGEKNWSLAQRTQVRKVILSVDTSVRLLIPLIFYTMSSHMFSRTNQITLKSCDDYLSYFQSFSRSVAEQSAPIQRFSNH